MSFWVITYLISWQELAENTDPTLGEISMILVQGSNYFYNKDTGANSEPGSVQS